MPRELSAVDTCCKAFHPISLTEKAGMIVAGWFLKKQRWSFRGGEGVGQWVNRMISKAKMMRGGGMIAAGGNHLGPWMLMIKGDGQLWSLGGRYHGHDQGAVTFPKIVEAMRGKKVVQVSAGGAHSLFMLESGEVLECGVSSRDTKFHVLAPESVASTIVAGPTVVKKEEEEAVKPKDEKQTLPATTA